MAPVRILEVIVDDLERAVGLLREASRVGVLTGAGISAESGVPTFRGPDGLWEGHRPEDLATPEAFRRDRETVWRFYHWRRQLVAPVRPNPGHEALVALERSKVGLRLITQNVDGLHRLAGSADPVEVHGSLWTLRCTGCGKQEENRRLDLPLVPTCENCGAALRPGVVWFGESLAIDSLVAMEQTAGRSEVLLVVGTSAVVYPAAGMVDIARASGVPVIEVNLERTPASRSVDALLQGKAGEVLPRLVEAALQGA